VEENVVDMTYELIRRNCFRTDAVTDKTEFPDSEEEYDSEEDSGSSGSEDDLSKDELSDLAEEETKERPVRPPIKYIDPT
jgi:hypothetical protein